MDIVPLRQRCRCSFVDSRLRGRGECAKLLPVKIDAHTTQEQLLKLSEQVLRRDLLQSTPLNLRFFLRYLILFLLFPGMVFGFKAGLGITLCFCAALVGILFWGSEAASALAIYSWLSCGLLVLLFVTIGVIRKAWHERELRRQFRPATPGLRHAVRNPQKYQLRWHKSNTDGYLASSLVLHVPAKGVYALLLTMRNFDGSHLVTQGKLGNALVYAGGGKGADFNALALYRLDAGLHELSWAIPSASKAPHTEVSLLNSGR